ncbi:MAG: AI-2E family transporter [Acutalibacteraceae bacterium]
MKIEWNRRYTTIAVYAILVLIFGILFFYGVQNFREVEAWFNAALITLRPFIFGFVIAYLLNPIYVFLDRKFLPWLTNNTINPPACRGLAIIVTYTLTGGVLYLFSALVFPQIIISISSIIGNLRSYADSLQQMLDVVTRLVPRWTACRWRSSTPWNSRWRMSSIRSMISCWARFPMSSTMP